MRSIFLNEDPGVEFVEEWTTHEFGIIDGLV